MLVVGFVIAAVLLTAEYLLCTKLENPLWGGMIPLFLLAGTVWLFCQRKNPFGNKVCIPLCYSEHPVFWRLGNRPGQIP